MLVLDTLTFMKTYSNFFLVTLLFPLTLSACGGGGSGSDGSIVHGSLIQLSDGAHSTDSLELRHSAGQKIDGVTICLLGECSVTDASGEWGVNVPEIPAGDILLTLKGHGIDSSKVINVPGGATDVTVELGNSSEGISLMALVVDGVDHTEHDHNHGESSEHTGETGHTDGK
jgi:hypothetical protein